MSNSASSPFRRRAPIALCDCGLAVAVDFLSDRWTLLILREAFYGVVRFDDIREDLAIPKATLTERLGRLIDKGLLEKRPYRDDGQRTRLAYMLTDKGKSLALPLLALMQWGDDHLLQNAPLASLAAKDRPAPIRVGYLDAKGNAVPAAEIHFLTPDPEDSQT